ncbi:MAG: DUF951 domain-containing protein [Lachnospiraceae bacterium]|nr:DUF951 domain-containing protein [Lachnospiraceae bacterium]
MNIRVGDVLKLKKKHPCGSLEWEVLRTGADIKLKCLGCGRMTMQPRSSVEKSIRSIQPRDSAERM